MKQTKELVMKGVYVLTFEVNDYDQHGSYFLTTFAKKPTLEELADWFSKNGRGSDVGKDMASAIKFLETLRNGGGRVGTQHVWYNLDFVEFGKVL